MIGYSPDSLSTVTFTPEFNAALERIVDAAGGTLTFTPDKFPELERAAGRIARAVSRRVDEILTAELAKAGE